ncbi:MAG: hypothetical protein ACYCW6_27755 [Candidatus Xenobia bacterium]
MSIIKGTQDGYEFRDDFQSGSLTASQAQSAATAAASAVQIDCEDYSAFEAVLSGTWSGTVVADESMDDGATWNTIDIYQAGVGLVQSVTANGTYQLRPHNGATQVRARCSSYSSGTIGVRVDANKGGASSFTITDRPLDSFAVSNAAAVNTQATISQAAAGAGVRNVCTSITATLSSDGTAPAAAQVDVVLRDGATGVGTILWEGTLSIQAVAGFTAPPLVATNLRIKGSANTAMTLEFTGAGGAHTYEAVSLTGFQMAD